MKIKKLLATLLTGLMLVSLAACGNPNAASSGEDKSTETGKETAAAETPEKSEAVTLKFFSNVPDRTSGLGLLEETNLNSFKEANTNVNFETEFLQDEPYKMKLQTYMQSKNMPDMWMQWGHPASLSPVVQGGFAAELNPDDYKDYGFVPGALEAFTVDGKLYGLPKNADFWVLYYNEKILKDNDIAVPKTTDDLIAAAKILNAKGIQAVSLTGKDRWPTAITLENLILRKTADPKKFNETIKAGTTSSNEDFLAGVNELIRLVDNNVFQPSYLSDDYGTAKNLFIQGQAAMYLMGSWEMGMAADETIPEEVRNNIRATKFPTVNGFPGTADDLVMWYGGGYSVSADSPNKEAAIKAMNHMLSPDVYAKNGWQKQITIPPMKYDQFLTGNENNLQKDITEIITSAKSTSGASYNDSLTASFKDASEGLTLEMSGKMVSPEEFLSKLDALIKEANAEQ